MVGGKTKEKNRVELRTQGKRVKQERNKVRCENRNRAKKRRKKKKQMMKLKRGFR